MRPNDGLYMHTNSSVEPVARKTLHDLLGNIDEGNLKRKIDSIEPDQIAVLQSTSGTTGLPKMAVRTHRALILESQAIEDNHSQKPHEVYRLFCTPIFHAFSTPEMVITPLRLGIPTYIMRRYDDTFAQKVHEYGITETAASPPMLNMLQERHTSHHLLQSLRMIFCGGAPLVRELRERTLAIFKTPPRIVQVWGMTEGGWFSTFKYPEDDTTGSVGRMVPGYEIKTSTDDPLEMTNGRKAGELLVKGPQLMTGYYGNEQASQDAFIDGWLKTGDIGYIEEGKVYLVDRSKDLIKVNGWQVAPAEIEAIVLELPEVKDAATIGIGYGVDERPLLFVESSHGKAVSNEDVVNHLRSKVAKHKIARIEVESIESIPRNPSGKILRKVLREKAIEVLRARARGVVDEGE
jgi:acyl-CoA synthetase (AMP-forming)/AMP-acid ligase II